MGGVPLATSRIGVNRADLIDVSAVMAAFELMNNVVIEGRMRVESVAGHSQLTILLIAHDARWEIAERAPLASVKCLPSQKGFTTLESAIMWSLYQLDGEMARLELARYKETA